MLDLFTTPDQGQPELPIAAAERRPGEVISSCANKFYPIIMLKISPKIKVVCLNPLEGEVTFYKR